MYGVTSPIFIRQLPGPTHPVEPDATDLPFFALPWDNSRNLFEFSANPIALAYYTNDRRDNLKTFGNIYGDFAILPALKLRSSVGLDLNLTHNKAFNQNFGDPDGGGSALGPAPDRASSQDRWTGRLPSPGSSGSATSAE